MIKFGISDVAKFERFREKGTLDTRPISCQLLRLKRPDDPTEVRRFEEISRLLLLPGKIFRTTYRGRFADLDEMAGRWIQKKWERGAVLRVEDWGASNGLTSAEWAQQLLPVFAKLEFVGSDISLHLVEASEREGESYVFDQSGVLIQYLKGPLVVQFMWRDSPLFVVNGWLKRRAEQTAQRIPLAGIPAQWQADAANRVAEVEGWRFRKISLLHPEAQVLAARDSRFRMIRHSVFEAAAQPCDILRTMNILNRKYFTEEQLRIGVAAAAESLVEGGLWIVGRTIGAADQPEEGAERENHVTLLEKSAGGFRVLERLGRGSEIEQLATGVPG